MTIENQKPTDFSLSQDLHTLLAEADGKPLHFDVVIIGSGYGGAVVASELAGTKKKNKEAEPLRIAVLERGKQYLPGMFPSTMSELAGHVRYAGKMDLRPHGAAGGLFDIRMGEDVVTLLGNGLGGGSLINAGVLEEPDPCIFDQACWPSAVKIAFGSKVEPNIDRLQGRFSTKFAETATLLGQHNTVIDDDRGPDKSSKSLQKFQRHAELGGKAFRPARFITVLKKDGYISKGGIRLSPCNNCGDCMTGCNHSAKISLDVSLLAKAKRKAPEHVHLITGATVLRFERVNDCWLVHVVHTDSSSRLHQGPAYKITADKLILSAGSLGSTEILLRSQSKTLQFSSRLGQQFSTNGDNVLAVYGLPDKVNAVADESAPADQRQVGPTITGIVDTNYSHNQAPRARFLAEEFSIPGPLRRVFEEIFTTANMAQELSEKDKSDHRQGEEAEVDPFAVNPATIKRTSLIGINGHDSADGVLVLKTHDKSNDLLGDGLIHIDWPGLKSADNFKAQIKKMERLLAAMPANKKGAARVIPNPLWRPLPAKLDMLLDGKSESGPLLTVHPIGGCPMGDDVHRGVVDAFGQVFDPLHQVNSKQSWFGTLLVLDASIFPTSIGVNPSLSIATLTRWAICNLRDGAWNLESIPDQKFEEVSLPAYRVPSYIKAKETKIELVERLTGMLSDPAAGDDVRVELTLNFEPVALSYLSSDMHRIIKLDRGTLREYRNQRAWQDAYDKDVSSEALRQVDGCTSLNIVHGAIQMLNRMPIASNEFERVNRTLWPWWRNRGKRDIWQWIDGNSEQRLFVKKTMLAFIEFCVLILRTQKNADGQRRTLRNVFKVIVGLEKLKKIVARFFQEKKDPKTVSLSKVFIKRVKLVLNAASRAGEQRIIQYHLHLENEQIIKGEKILRYSIATNPLLQLNELQLTEYRGRKIPDQIKAGVAIEQPHLTSDSLVAFVKSFIIWMVRRLLRRLVRRVRSYFLVKAKPKKISDTVPDGVLSLDTRYLTRKHLPLIRIVSDDQTAYPNTPDAMADVLSFGLYMARLMMQIHLWTFRKPDAFTSAPVSSKNHRLPGQLPDLDTPEIQEIEVAAPLANGRSVKMRLTRYRQHAESNGDTTPILLIHGYSASGTTFAHPSIPLDLTRFLSQKNKGRDVWILDLRSSCGMPSATHGWTMEEVGCNDIPLAVAHIRSATGHTKIDVIAHCVGCAMFSMAVLIKPNEGDDHFAARMALPSSIRSAVLSQYGPVVAVTPDNNLRAYTMSYLRLYMENTAYQFKTNPDDGFAVLDRLLNSLPYPKHEFAIENPIDTQDEERYQELRPWTSIRHRMDGLYGRTFSLENMDLETLNHIDDFFGPMNLDTLAQMTQFSRYRRVTNRQGENALNLPDSMSERWLFPTLSLHSEKNGMIDFSTKKLMQGLFDGFENVGYKAFVCEGIGHQDVFIGTQKATMRGFEEIDRFLNEVYLNSHPKSCRRPRESKLVMHAAIPWMGPLFKALRMADDHQQMTYLEFCVAGSPAMPAPVRIVALCGLHADSDVWSGNSARVQILLDAPLDPASHVDGWIHHEVKWNNLPLRGQNTQPIRAYVFLIYEVPGWMTGKTEEQIEQDMENGQTPTYAEMAKSLFKQNDPREFEKSALVLELPTSTAFALASCQYSKGILDELPTSTSIRRLAERFDTRKNPDPYGILRDKPAFLLLLGDQIYIDETAGVFNPVTQEDLDQRKYESLYHESVGLRTVLQNIPCWRMLDDHEIEDNWEPSYFSRGRNNPRVIESYRRRELGIKKYWRYQRMTGPDRVAGNSNALYFSMQRPLNGSAFAFFICDTRTQRGCRYGRNSVEQAHIVDPQQQGALFSWLREQKESTQEKPKFICSPAIFLPRLKTSGGVHPNPWLSDAWDGFPSSMASLLKLIVDEQIAGVVFLSGDAHLCCTVKAIITGPLPKAGATAGKPKSMSILSIHSSGLYAPYPFANAQWEEFASRETFYFDVDGERYSCEVEAQRSATQGDGFALIQPIKVAEREWSLNVEFDLSGGRSMRQLWF